MIPQTVIDEGVEQGKLEILNISEGDTEITFDEGNAEELQHAKEVIEDMMKRGYTILVHTKRGLRRVKRFNPKRNCYVIGERKGKDTTVPLKGTKATAVGRTAGG